MYPRIPWELGADPLGSVERTLLTVALDLEQTIDWFMLTNEITNCMEHSLSDTSSCSASQEILRILRNAAIYCHVQDSL